MKTLDELVQMLAPDLQREVEDFVRFLLETRGQPKGARLRMDWAGALSEFRGQRRVSPFRDSAAFCFEMRLAAV